MSELNEQTTLSQWQRLLKNEGTWQGSFTQLSAQGQFLSEIATEVELTPRDHNKAMHQEVRRYPKGGEPSVQVLDYRSLNRATLFFEEGAFSQGSLQWGPYSEFGAELGLIAGDRRLRLVQLFDTSGEFKQLTLIREQIKGSDAPEREQLQLSDLIGTWEGEAVTQYADLRPEQSYSTQLVVEQINQSTVRQTLKMGESAPPITSTGTLNGRVLSFADSGVQVLLLPDGASATFPARITPGKPLFLEAGWLLDANTRQRIIRSYESGGAWVSLTLVTERKIT